MQVGSIAEFLSEIPCNIISTLENDAVQAENFIKQLEQGQVPTLIQDLPEEVQGVFQSVFGIFNTLPSEIIDSAEATVTGVAQIFEDIADGSIVSNIEAIPGAVVSEITNG